ncbi:hypothetical protein HYPSUDRAFT_655818 [Hypholoma sublateritium FD-334 SS-4]|uniref:Nephrocystin 3-like N-terminal domain-containing protein n=1 Tax=Hypholoma sublateritium (strain FD-334 SS-4) TaxID=945553 RepID=A0A0D2MFK1_HYPSF|nr:hypothetical protein HYPSUDRAFT_655818 [Hypholoma sublateritium FD-334 SS-4]
MPVFSRPTHRKDTVEFFSNADHPVIYGGHFTSVSNSTTQKDGFQILQEHVSTAAFHNSKQRVDPPRCHAHTREAVLEELFNWVVGDVPREAWIAWLNGAAGAGKSAICQSVAEVCIHRGVKVASFFFFRADPTRNTIDPVIATLAYQIIQLFPETKELIVHSIESHPLIFEQTFETQLEVLIVTPIRRLQISDTLLFIIDGVDECTGYDVQIDVIRTFSKVLQHGDLPVVILFGSRRETQIQMAFNARDMGGILKQLPLDNNYQAEEDIQRFLVDRFDDIKLTHPQRKRLKPEWPAAEHVQQIVDKSSGQFVYASVVIKFVSMPSSNPSTQLEIVRGLRPAGRATPFAELDALYRHIFLQVEDIAAVLGILAYSILGSINDLGTSAYFFDITADDAESMLAPLTSVLHCDAEWDEIVFHHASLPDFLRDKERSQEFCISEMGTDLTILWFKNAASNRFKTLWEDEKNMDLDVFLGCAKPTSDLRALMMHYTPLQTPFAYSWPTWPKSVLDEIRKMDFGDNGELYRIMSDRIFRYVKKEYPTLLVHIMSEFTTVTKEELGRRPRPVDQSIEAKSTIQSRFKKWLKRG